MALIVLPILLLIPALLAALLLDSLWKAWAFARRDDIRATPVPQIVHFRQRFIRLYRWRGIVLILLILLSVPLLQVRVLDNGVARPVPWWMTATQATVLSGILVAVIGGALLFAGLFLQRNLGWGVFVGLGTFVSLTLMLAAIMAVVFGLPDDWHTVSHHYESVGPDGVSYGIGGVSTSLASFYSALALFPAGILVALDRIRTSLSRHD